MSILIPYIASSLVAFSGLFIGAWLALKIKEEMKGALRYLPWLQKIILLGVLFAFFNHEKQQTFIVILIFLVFLFSVWKKHELGYYPILAIFFVLMGQGSTTLYQIATLTFLYGFPTGTLYTVRNNGKSLVDISKKITKSYGIFLVMTITLHILWAAFILKDFS